MPSLAPYFVYQATAGAVFSQAVFVVFYQERVGLSLSAVLWLQSYFVLVRALLDVPFGALADRVSRRLCLVASGVVLAVGSAGILWWPSLGMAVVLETMLAMVSALRSGADSALLYDTLDTAGALDRYPRAESLSQAISSLGSGAVAIAGSILAAHDLAWPYVANIAAGSATVVAAACLREPPRHHRARGILRDAARVVARTPAVRWTIALAALVVSASHVYFFLQQPYLRAIGVPLALFGAVVAATKVVTALVATGAHRIESRLGVRGSAALMAAVPAVGLGAMAAVASPVGALVILTRGVLDGLWMPLLNVLMNRLVDSRLRATILSVQSLVSRLALASVVGLCGVATAHVGLDATLAVAAATSLVLGAALVVTAPRLPERSRVIAERA
ncbi:MAG TPA: MFS transporter [Candidatus Eisenbacteria bacterium]|nr:MFS transporter [Candidatus Eisenbacteria bacterium]